MPKALKENMNLRDFFENAGFEVVDMRSKGGCLWVIGEQSELTPVIKEAQEAFQSQGRFAQGKATRYRNGWYTKSER